MIAYTCKDLSLMQRWNLRKYIREEMKDMSTLPDAPISIEAVRTIQKKQYSSLWYGGTVVNIKYKGWNFELCANGDVYADLYHKDDPSYPRLHVKDKRNGGQLGEELPAYIATDKELRSALCHSHSGYQLILDYGNWWECFPIDPQGTPHDLMWCLDSDNIIAAIAEVIAGMDEVIQDMSVSGQELQTAG